MLWSAPPHWMLMLTGVICALSPPSKWLLLKFYLSSVLVPAPELRTASLSMVCTTGWVLGADSPLLCLWETFWGGAVGFFPFSSLATHFEKPIASVINLHRKSLLTVSLLSYAVFELCLLFCVWVSKFSLSQGESFVFMDVSEHAFGFPMLPTSLLRSLDLFSHYFHLWVESPTEL